MGEPAGFECKASIINAFRNWSYICVREIRYVKGLKSSRPSWNSAQLRMTLKLLMLLLSAGIISTHYSVYMCLVYAMVGIESRASSIELISSPRQYIKASNSAKQFLLASHLLEISVIQSLPIKRITWMETPEMCAGAHALLNLKFLGEA